LEDEFHLLKEKLVFETKGEPAGDVLEALVDLLVDLHCRDDGSCGPQSEGNA
jgi:hypothetical protein